VSFFTELKRRNVFRVGIAYVVASWVLLQVADLVLENIGAPDWVIQALMLIVVLGFVAALAIAWAYELTPEGIRKESEVERSDSISAQTGRKLDRIIIAFLAVALGYFVWESRFRDQPAPEPAPAPMQVAKAVTAAPEPVPADEPRQKSIVVLPFVNMSADPDQEFFSDGLSEEILNALVKLRDLRVISRTSAFAFKGKDVSIPEIAAQLDVSHVLEGSVRKAGNDVRITAQLIEVATDSHLWSEAYNRSLENIFEIQEEISLAIADELQVTLGAGEGGKRPTDNIEAYEKFLLGRHLYQQRGPEDLDRAIEILKVVVETEPGFTDAWAILAGASVVRSFQLDEGFQALIEQSRDAARKAIELDAESGFSHAVLGLLYLQELQWEEAMAQLDRAIELNPSEPNSLLWKGIGLNMLGYNEQALGYLLRAENVDPIWGLAQSWIVSAYASIGDIDGVERHARKRHDINAEGSGYELGIVELLKGNMEGSEEQFAREDIRRIGTDLLARTQFSALRDPSLRPQSIQLLLDNEERVGSRTLVPYLWPLGATEEAIAHIYRVIESGRGLRVGIGIGEFWFANNREHLSDPGLPAVFERVGMADYWREHGDPDLCRVRGEEIRCGAP